MVGQGDLDIILRIAGSRQTAVRNSPIPIMIAAYLQ